MSKVYNLSVPTSLDSITLEQYQKYVKVVTENKDAMDDEFIKLKVLEIFCGLSMKEAYELAATDVDDIVNLVLVALNKESPLQRRFFMTDAKGKTVEFGFIPNLEKISLGEFIDAEAYVGDWEKMHRALAVLYRPITGSKGEFYEIEPYETSEKYAEVMKDAPASVATGAMLFFYHLGRTLSIVTLRSLVDQEHKKTNSEDLHQDQTPLSKSGDGINLSTLSLQEMSSELARLQEEVYTNVSYGSNLKKKKTS